MDWTEELRNVLFGVLSCGAMLSGVQSTVVDCVLHRWGRIRRSFGMLAKWFSSTRLETRTKESNIYASVWVENPNAE